MKKLLVVLFVCICFCSPSGSAWAVPLDITSAGVEVTGPTTFTMHNALVGPNLYWVDFLWNPAWNVFRISGSSYGLEIPTFKASEYYPLQVGDTWTYQRSGGGTLTRTVTGVEDVCGVPCMRVENTDGGIEWWVSDDTGVWVAKVQNPDGSYVVYCPLRIANPYTYRGFSKMTPYEDVPIYDPIGTLVGDMTGYFSYTGTGAESVAAPAGMFIDAARCNLTQSFSNPWTTNVLTDEMWFARGVGPVKQISINVSTEGGALLSSDTEVLILESATVGGVTYPWTDPLQLTNNIGFDTTPAIVELRKGKILLAWSINLSLYCKISSDGGRTWSKPTLIASGYVNIDPELMQDSTGKVWVIWTCDRDGEYDIWYATSQTDGKSWSAPQKIYTPEAYSQQGSIIQAQNAEIRIFWNKEFVTSTDGGATWSSITYLPFQPWNNASLRQTHDGTLWVVGWTGSDISAGKSTDDGLTWSHPIPITDSSEAVDPGIGPIMTQTSDGTMWVIWHSQHMGNKDIYYAKSVDNGDTWSAPVQLTADANQDLMPEIAQIGNELWFVWQSDRTGNFEVYADKVK